MRGYGEPLPRERDAERRSRLCLREAAALTNSTLYHTVSHFPQSIRREIFFFRFFFNE